LNIAINFSFVIDEYTTGIIEVVTITTSVSRNILNTLKRGHKGMVSLEFDCVLHTWPPNNIGHLTSEGQRDEDAKKIYRILSMI
jgi:hypothetical protein